MRVPTGKTALVAIIGDPVAHVRAPAFFNARFEELGLDAAMVALHVPAAGLADIVPQLARCPNLVGLIVTIPHKEALAPLCRELGPAARLMGAVNTVRLDGKGHLAGDMFDGVGLVAALRAHDLEPAAARVLLVGAGGASRAIAFALAAEGAAEIAIWNRTPERAGRLAGEVAAAFPSVSVRTAPADAHGFDLVVNGTSLGMHAGEPMPIDPTTLAATTAFVDIVSVRDTELMQAAAARGCRVVGGLPMATLQVDAQLAFLGLLFAR